MLFFHLLFYSLVLITFAYYVKSGDLLFPIMTCNNPSRKYLSIATLAPFPGPQPSFSSLILVCTWESLEVATALMWQFKLE